MREGLLKLISQVQDCGADVTDVVEMIWVENQTLVDHLIANGVVIPVRCKDCRYVQVWKSGYWCDCNEHYVRENEFCSEGVRKDNE